MQELPVAVVGRLSLSGTVVEVAGDDHLAEVAEVVVVHHALLSAG